MCELTLQMILLCNCSLSLNICKAYKNLRFLSTTVLQDSVATRVNGGGIFNDFVIANLLLSMMVKEFWRSVRIWQKQSYGKNIVASFFPDTLWRHLKACFHYLHVIMMWNIRHVRERCWKGFQGYGVKGQGHGVTAVKIVWTRLLVNRDWRDV